MSKPFSDELVAETVELTQRTDPIAGTGGLTALGYRLLQTIVELTPTAYQPVADEVVE